MSPDQGPEALFEGSKRNSGYQTVSKFYNLIVESSGSTRRIQRAQDRENPTSLSQEIVHRTIYNQRILVGFKGVWRGFHTVVTANLHLSTIESMFVLREVLGGRRFLWCQKIRQLYYTMEGECDLWFSVISMRKYE
ncbi:hypothetical protein M5K25_001242 [Dendrobium thyrsiflorum]|uniref:Uncharacterized protein n=1 Tax=Dendrobium thyrsiflorum TaxID=117978 RepID=A0ABD0VWF2_DENTH